jgi:hypothetical protein
VDFVFQSHFEVAHEITFEFSKTRRLKASIVESEEPAVARHRLGRHVPAAIN